MYLSLSKIIYQTIEKLTIEIVNIHPKHTILIIDVNYLTFS